MCVFKTKERERSISLFIHHGRSNSCPAQACNSASIRVNSSCVSVKTSAQLQKEVNETFWTYSKAIIGCIANESRRFHIFAANLVKQIQDNSSPQQWRYVATKVNPADHASRVLPLHELLRSRWITGPSFLCEDDCVWWAKLNEKSIKFSEDDPVVKKSVFLVRSTDKNSQA